MYTSSVLNKKNTLYSELQKKNLTRFENALFIHLDL
jgi:hypothetical protein